MVDQARLESVDEELDGFGIGSARLEAARARAVASKLSLSAADEALLSLAGRFETQVPDGALARPASWARASEPAPREVPEDASGLLELDASTLAAAPLPAVLSDVPPPPAESAAESAEGASQSAAEAAESAQEPVADEPGERPSVEISVEVSPEPDFFDGTEAPEDEAATRERPGTDPAPAGEPDELAARGPEGDFTPGPSALELELEGEAPVEQAPPPRSASFAPPRDSVHPRPGSIVPAPPADLEAELASILAAELEGGAQPSADEDSDFEPEPTALFTADMFGASEEPSLAKLMSELPPADLGGEEDSLEIDIDDEAMIVEEPAPPPPVAASRFPPGNGPPQGTRPPPPPSKSMPPDAGKPGFLGRLLNRK